jgi:superfamily II DNA or RNA helicase/HKD family nuclease
MASASQFHPVHDHDSPDPLANRQTKERSIRKPKSELLSTGIYEQLLDEHLQERLRVLLETDPSLRSVFGKIDPEEEPSRYAAFLSRILEKALQLEHDPAARLKLCNQIVDRLAGSQDGRFLEQHRLLPNAEPLLLEITPRDYAKEGIPRPETSLTESSLFTGSPADPQLVHELKREMLSADSVDVLVSFIMWGGLRLLMPAFEELSARGGRIRVITTSYMGNSDAHAVERLAALANVEIRVSFDTERTRLHAKAYHFKRSTGFSTAYIGSSNMSHAAMTSGLEWNLKVTEQDMPHILEKFAAEFETYWNSHEFLPYDPSTPQPFREAIKRARTKRSYAQVYLEITPRPFQERILEALQTERETHHHFRNLVVAATGTGKTVIAAFDFRRFFEARKRQARLLFVAHRREILEQTIGTFRAILRVPDFGELLVGEDEADRLDHLFCSVGMLNTRRLWEKVGSDYYDFIIVDEVHHGVAASYRALFDHFKPQVLLGLTATPERMDGGSVAADFGDRFAAEIRLPEALEEKLLCPFHYFGVADPVSLAADRFWKNGKYDIAELDNVYTGAHVLAKQRLEVIVTSLIRFEPDLERVRGIGFCASVKHAQFMTEEFNRCKITSALLVGETASEQRSQLLNDFRAGKIRFLFTRDVLNEGLDVPDINTVLFLRPTDSLTIFLQQLGRGLRHAPGKDCLTVLDFVGQAHRRYRIDRKLKALLSKRRFNVEREVEMDFPHLPAGCSIQLDRVARDHVLRNIRENLKNLKVQVPERLESFEHESGEQLTFGNFIRYHGYEPEALLSKATWSQWKSLARLSPPPDDADLTRLQSALLGASQMRGVRELTKMAQWVERLSEGQIDDALAIAADAALVYHYRLWGQPGSKLGMKNLRDSFSRAAQNPSILRDLNEVLAWAADETRLPDIDLQLPFSCPLELHANYGSDEIKAALGEATFGSPGQTGVGFFHFKPLKAIGALVTFQKTEKEFSPSTMYHDYPISRDLLHWETQAQTSLGSEKAQNMIRHVERGYTMLFFARSRKKIEGVTSPFTFLGPATLVSHQSERPIQMVWRLHHPMPVEMFEDNRRGG